MLDNTLTVAKLTSIFARTNAASEDDADGDDDVQELCFEEFVQLIAAVCDTKVPADTRKGVAFELTLQSWLHLIFLPKFRTILKDKFNRCWIDMGPEECFTETLDAPWQDFLRDISIPVR